MHVPPEIRKSVGFACYRSHDNDLRYAGTVFFVQDVANLQMGKAYTYTVTAMHVITHVQKRSIDGKVLIRLNLRSGGVGSFETHTSDWHFHPTLPRNVDAAVLGDVPPQDQFDYTTTAESIAVTEEMIQRDGISIGDEVFVVGLFSQHIGKSKNLPIIRVGNVAMLPEESIAGVDFDPMAAYLIECHSIGGLSGSPVFVYHNELRPMGLTTFLTSTPILYWLGLIHGHYDVELPIEDALVGNIQRKGDVNMGIAAVVPASKILETVRQPDLLARKERELSELLDKDGTSA